MADARVCSACGSSVSPTAKFCGQCGTALSSAAVGESSGAASSQAEVAEPATESPPAGRWVRTCEGCGTTSPATTATCPTCGAKLFRMPRHWDGPGDPPPYFPQKPPAPASRRDNRALAPDSGGAPQRIAPRFRLSRRSLVVLIVAAGVAILGEIISAVNQTNSAARVPQSDATDGLDYLNSSNPQSIHTKVGACIYNTLYQAREVAMVEGEQGDTADYHSMMQSLASPSDFAQLEQSCAKHPVAYDAGPVVIDPPDALSASSTPVTATQTHSTGTQPSPQVGGYSLKWEMVEGAKVMLPPWTRVKVGGYGDWAGFQYSNPDDTAEIITITGGADVGEVVADTKDAFETWEPFGFAGPVSSKSVFNNGLSVRFQSPSRNHQGYVTDGVFTALRCSGEWDGYEQIVVRHPKTVVETNRATLILNSFQPAC